MSGDEADFFLFCLEPTTILVQESTLAFWLRGSLSPRGFDSPLELPSQLLHTIYQTQGSGTTHRRGIF